MKPRVVVDTNTLIAARWRPASASYRIFDMCIRGNLQALISHAIERENHLILKKIHAPTAFMQRVEAYFRASEKILSPPRIAVCEDPDDDRFIACAIKGRADAIISSDRHLLTLGSYGGIVVCKPTEFLRRESVTVERGHN